jgi:hypothetical protein
VGLTRLASKAGAEANITYTQMLQISDLRRSITHAYQHSAVQAMYYDNMDPQHRWLNPNPTEAVSATTLMEGGGVPPLLVLIALGVWAVGVAGLGAIYGFQERWSATLDANSIFWCSRNCEGKGGEGEERIKMELFEDPEGKIQIR